MCKSYASFWDMIYLCIESLQILSYFGGKEKDLLRGRNSIDYRRPGILVLINDADWELEGEEEYILQERDNLLFVSTLHGG